MRDPAPQRPAMVDRYTLLQRGAVHRAHAALRARDARPRVQLILVNNASDDRSEALCRSLLAGNGIDAEFVFEAKPGPSHALEAGLKHVTTPFVALWIADTWYPDTYLERAEGLFADPEVVAAMAVDIYAPANHWYGWLTRFTSAT